uniref:EamA domain-containing protein n=1 Tax=Chromera velia CCMP2878 TaxID=1169474 RepID=A0A0G4HPI9_9ALVE|eukprot:Cvel_29901.t1-p1 / transcript=Cvel_29901.t1 / gene=Cvel_29901 / organism=Chromera_velia_CCMP2878 / gene_product=WAT1-related protein At3g45870, putative / transcript_product=WAT1-related protein At3g45870, putative / location=Cvel_scaffold4176:6958-9046(+) / protein_length=503 / sequence_SO=supercontig / SO=protein_coding / is_pseudo=false
MQRELECDVTVRRDDRTRHTKAWMPHVALAVTMILLGLGSVIGKLGMQKFNPVFFAFLRELFSGPILACFAWVVYRRGPGRLPPRVWRRLAVLGLCLFVNQFCFLVGLKFADENSASAWQPSQPIITMVIAFFIGLEGLSWQKVAGILFAFFGALVLVMGKVWFEDEGLGGSKKEGGTLAAVIGNLLFFLNCAGTSCYVVFSKPLLVRPSSLGFTMDSMWVIAVAYGFAASIMLVACLVINFVPPLLHLICPDCGDHAWVVPAGAVWALAYWIIASSVLAYMLITWANAQPSCNASTVSAYTALQPLAAVLASVFLILTNLAPPGVLSLPGWNLFGGVGILAGLALIVFDGGGQRGGTEQASLTEDSERGGGLGLTGVEMDSDSNGNGGSLGGMKSVSGPVAAKERGEGGDVNESVAGPRGGRGGQAAGNQGCTGLLSPQPLYVRGGLQGLEGLGRRTVDQRSTRDPDESPGASPLGVRSLEEGRQLLQGRLQAEIANERGGR